MSNSNIAACVAFLQALPDGVSESPPDVHDDSSGLSAAVSALFARLTLRRQQDNAFAAVTDRVLEGQMVDETLEHIYEGFRGLIPYDRIGFATISDDGRIARARWARSEAEAIFLVRGYAAKLAGSTLLDVMRSGRPRILNDLEQYLQEHPGSHSTKLILKEGVRSSLTCPLIAAGKPVGFLFFSSAQPHQYSEEHTETFLRLAGLLSGVLERSQLYEQLVNANAALLEVRETLELSASLDPLTGALSRQAVLQRVQSLLDAAAGGKEGAVIAIDWPDHAQIYEYYGFEAGDAILAEMAGRLSAALSPTDYLGRLRDGSFVMTVADTADQAAERLAMRLRDDIEPVPFAVPGAVLRVKTSVGLAVARRFESETPEWIIRRALQQGRATLESATTAA